MNPRQQIVSKTMEGYPLKGSLLLVAHQWHCIPVSQVQEQKTQGRRIGGGGRLRARGGVREARVLVQVQEEKGEIGVIAEVVDLRSRIQKIFSSKNHDFFSIKLKIYQAPFITEGKEGVRR